ncbi:hypothetical protein CDAR_427011 [Caerostris darwini]|uniref:Uncharacterized protein n=1 Tax=Caerostris darwini TaxID=1538125 RepID=A0AAV4R7Y6_9ARAC|nr:hypothetical protein CDAR_427011 [Caerostris darwini]
MCLFNSNFSEGKSIGKTSSAARKLSKLTDTHHVLQFRIKSRLSDFISIFKSLLHGDFFSMGAQNREKLVALIETHSMGHSPLPHSTLHSRSPCGAGLLGHAYTLEWNSKSSSSLQKTDTRQQMVHDSESY